jgi:predicted HNH restriction endonuclease
MSDRRGKEFPPSVIEQDFRKSGGSCERCGSKERIEIHHILPIWFAAEYFPQLASFALISAENAQAVCHSCHVKIHRPGADESEFYNQAIYLLSLFGNELF